MAAGNELVEVSEGIISPALARAGDIVDTLYTLTANLNYTGEDEKEDDEIAAYAAMVDARAPLVEELAALKEQLTPADRAAMEYKDIVRTIADIADMENAHRTFFEQLRDEVRGAIKEIKQGQKINSAYGMEVTYDDYSRINKKN